MRSKAEHHWFTHGCLGCKKDNICKPKDDFPELAEKVRHAGAVVVGGYSPYGAVDGFTKAFLDRLFSLRHQNGLNKGKLAVVVATGIGRGAPGLEEASNQITHALNLEGMNVLGQLKVTGNPECMVCGFGQSCPMSALPRIFGDDTTVTPEKFCNVEDQTETWEEAKVLGREIARKLGAQMRMQPEGLSVLILTERRYLNVQVWNLWRRSPQTTVHHGIRKV